MANAKRMWGDIGLDPMFIVYLRLTYYKGSSRFQELLIGSAVNLFRSACFTLQSWCPSPDARHSLSLGCRRSLTWKFYSSWIMNRHLAPSERTVQLLANSLIFHHSSYIFLGVKNHTNYLHVGIVTWVRVKSWESSEADFLVSSSKTTRFQPLFQVPNIHWTRFRWSELGSRILEDESNLCCMRTFLYRGRVLHQNQEVYDTADPMIIAK